MREDLEAGTGPKSAPSTVHVVDRADRLDVDVPICRTVGSLIRGWEIGAGVREPGEKRE